MRYPKTKKEHLDHKRLLSMLSNHFTDDEKEIREDEDEDEGREDEPRDNERGYDSDEYFERDGFGDPMDTFVEPYRSHENREMDYEDDEGKESDDHGDYDEEGESDEGGKRASKEDRKNMSIVMLGKRIGKSKYKKM
jgi:hypothetical protein